MALKKLFDNIFYLFLFLIPFQVSLFLGNINKTWSFYNDFIGFWLYLSDILIILILIFSWRKLLNLIKTKNRGISILLIIFSIWTVHSGICSISHQIALYSAFRLLLGISLFLYIKEVVAQNRVLQLKSYFIIFLSGVIQAIIGIWQFIQQKSIGLRLVGESVFNQTTAGIAKINYNGGKLVRAYGTFPHPNILGGFLLLAIVCGVLIAVTMEPAKEEQQSVIPAKVGIQSFIIAGMISLLVCLILTFSRSAWLAGSIIFAVGIIYFFIKKQQSVIPTFAGMIIIFASIIIFSFPLLKNRLTSYQNAIETRGFTTRIALETIKQHPFIGIGWGNFIPQALEITQNQSLEQWQIQPVHNIYLLIFAEIGIIGLLIFLIFLTSLLKQAFSQIKSSPEIFLLFSLFCGFLIIGMFDHYFFTLQQGIIMFWLSAGLLTSKYDH